MQDKLTAGAERFIRAVTEFIFVEDQPEQADVILIPGSRKVEHAIRAAELYRAGYAPYVLPSGRYTISRGYFLPLPEPLCSEYPGEFETEWHFLKAVLMRHGVPEEAILREDQATYTWENAQFSRDVLTAISEPGTAESLDAFACSEMLEKLSGVAMPPQVRHLKDLPILHRAECDAAEMGAAVLREFGE